MLNQKFKDSLYLFFAALICMLVGMIEFVHIVLKVSTYTMYAGIAFFASGVMLFFISIEQLKEVTTCQADARPEDSQ